MSIWNRLIKIGSSLYLTSDGTSTGDMIITDVTGLDKLRPAKTGPIVLAMSGAGKKFRRPNNGEGTLLSIAMARMPDAANSTLDDVIAVNDTAETGTNIVRLIFGDQANDGVTVDCLVGHPGGIEGVEYPGGFIEHGSEILKIDAVLNYTVTDIV